MEFRVLGPLSVTREGTPVDVGGPRQQIVLASLLLAAPRPVGVDALVDAVWPDGPPATARGQIQICVSRLRRALEPGPGTIATRPPGYAIELDGALLDLAEFDAALARARTEAARPAAAAAALHAALGMWRGEVLVGIDSPVVRDAATRLADRRLGAVEEFVDLELRRGRHAEAVDLLATEVDRNPLRDRLRAQLMLALYRCGRQADALREFQRARRYAADELGLDPVPELRALEEAILRGAPELAVPTAEPVPAAPPVPGLVEVPRMLPAPIADFTGRTTSSQEIEKALTGSAGRDDAVPVAVLTGPGGTGKSALAVHVARRVATLFPDGQLHAGLQGATRPLRPAQVLERFLRALGVPGASIPETLDDRAELYRERLTGRRVLVVLDDIASVAQVLPLLPPDGGSALIVTSRRRVTSLPGAHRVELGSFSPASALELLERVVGAERVAAEPEEAATLVRLCGHLPLAVRIAAARLAARPHWSLATMVDRLSDDGPLDELRHDDMAVRATLLLAYETLEPGARRLLRLVSLVDAPDFGGWAGAALLDAPARDAQDQMDELVEMHLVDVDVQPGGGDATTRYRLHDLVRLFARERSAQEDGTAERERAVARFLGAFLQLLDHAYRREHGGDHLVLRGDAPRYPVDERTSRRLLREPLRWLAAEQQAIVSAVTQAAAAGADGLCWELALGAVTLFEAHAHLDEWRETHAVALDAARLAGNRMGEAVVRYSQGSLALVEQRLDDADRELTQSLPLFTDLDSTRGVGMALRNLGSVARLRGRNRTAREFYERALEILRVTGERLGEAHVLNSIAQLDLDDGLEEAAMTKLTAAAAICADVPNRRIAAQVSYRLGEMNLRAGRLEAAEEAFAAVLRFAEEAGDRIGEVFGLVGIGAVLVERGEPALVPLTRAERLAAELGQVGQQVRALVLLSRDTLRDRGQVAAAQAHAEAAVRVAERMGSPPVLAVARAQFDTVRAGPGPG